MIADLNALGTLKRVVSSPARSALFSAGSQVLYSPLRRPFIRLATGQVDNRMRVEKEGLDRQKVTFQRKLMWLAILQTLDRAAEQRLVSPHVMRVILELWTRALWDQTFKARSIKLFKAEYGSGPPWLLVISPGNACNLRCPGCYADSGEGDAMLEWPLVDRILSEARSLWGIRLASFSGGEPLLYSSCGRDIFDIASVHSDCLFLTFTNCTLLDERMAARLASAGNMTLALSVDGMKARTDKHRGAGVFDSVVEGMGLLRRSGVPFGISVTVRQDNLAEVLSEEFLDFFFKRQGAFYGFYFQYLPIGREPAFEAMPTPEQRVQFWRRVWEVVEREHLFILDFWNHGPLVGGCVAAGRERGYLHIDWNGNVSPCVFAPYSSGNVRDCFRAGKNLNDIWKAPFLEAIRDWQRQYGFGKPQLTKDGNWLRACPFRDHHAMFRQWIDEYNPTPVNKSARSLLEETAFQRLVNYDAEYEKLARQIWEEEYLGIDDARESGKIDNQHVEWKLRDAGRESPDPV